MREAAIISTARTGLAKAMRGGFNKTHGIAHGGYSMSLADIFLGSMVFTACGKKPCSTISLNCNFVSPGLQDDIIECDAKVTKTTKSLVFVEGNLISKDKIILSASGIWKILNQ